MASPAAKWLPTSKHFIHLYEDIQALLDIIGLTSELKDHQEVIYLVSAHKMCM